MTVVEGQVAWVDKVPCPRCKMAYPGIGALSRRDNRTEVCSECGSEEAVIQFYAMDDVRNGVQKTIPLGEWDEAVYAVGRRNAEALRDAAR